MTHRSSIIFAALTHALGVWGGASAQTTNVSDGGRVAASKDPTTPIDAVAVSNEPATPMDTPAVSHGESTVIGKTADTFADFAGSRENAMRLANGLRTGSEITLTGSTNGGGTPESTSFAPATKPMGHGNVFKSLALARDLLAGYGIDNPTPSRSRPR